jgi:hypothetical protein
LSWRARRPWRPRGARTRSRWARRTWWPYRTVASIFTITPIFPIFTIFTITTIATITTRRPRRP